MKSDFDAFEHRGHLRLSAGALLSLRPRHATCLRVVSGQVWITQTGDATDHVLSMGQSIWLAPRGLTVLQADSELVFALDARNARDTNFWQRLKNVHQHPRTPTDLVTR